MAKKTEWQGISKAYAKRVMRTRGFPLADVNEAIELAPQFSTGQHYAVSEDGEHVALVTVQGEDEWDVKILHHTEIASPAPLTFHTEPSPTMICADCRQGTPRGDVVEVEQPELPGMPLFVCPSCAIKRSAAQHGHATTCTEHGGRDLAACDPADCDEAALAASYTVIVRDDEPGDDGDWLNDFSNEFRAERAAQRAQDASARREHDEAGPGHAAWCAGASTHWATGLAEQGARFHHARRGHFHDLAGLTDWCQDPTCTHVI